MNGDRPILSIVTPCLNQAPYLPVALRSVADQKLPAGSAEHIVIDGGSTDGSVQIIAGHADRLTRWASEPDRGQSDAINKGMAMATGTWAAWLNADDWYEPDALRLVAETLRRDPSIDVLVGRCRFIDEAGQTVFAPKPPDPPTLADLLRLRSAWFAGRSLAQPEVFFRRELFRAVGGLDPENHYSMDYELWGRLLAAGARFVSIDAHLANMRVHSGQKTAANRAVVRSALAAARRLRSLNRDLPAEEAASIDAELDGIERKLRIADALARRWTGRGETTPQEAGAPAAARDEKWVEAVSRLSAPAHEQLIKEAAGRLRLRRRIRALYVGEGPLLGLLAGRFGRRLDASAFVGADAGPGRETADRSVRRTRISITPLPDFPGACPDGPFDLVVTDLVLVHRRNPNGPVTACWERLRTGGLYLQGAEPIHDEALAGYLAAVQRIVDDQLSANNDVVLARHADAALLRWIAPALDGEDVWPAACPGGMGVHLAPIIRGLNPPAQRLAELRFGRASYLPCAPWPTIVRALPGPAFHGWGASLWRKR